MEEKRRWFSQFFKTEQETKEVKKSSEDLIKKADAGSKCGPDGCNLIIETMQGGVEVHYYWFLNFLRSKNAFGLGYDHIIKIRDVYAAGESSSFWGSQ